QQQAPTRVFVLTETTAKDELLAHYKVERAFAKPLDLEAIEKTFGNMKTQSDEYLVAS
ncbi:MAG: hypothetical protein HRT61_22815, partial [Ekhidna sp.]|nr:hypothetical protein [Ekhidna sp.]